MLDDILGKYRVAAKAYAVSLDIHKISMRFPKFEQYELGRQLRTASKSVCANLVEGLGKNQSEKDKRRFVQIAIGSNDETKLWLLYGRDLGYLDQIIYRDLQERVEEVGKMLFGLRKKLEA